MSDNGVGNPGRLKRSRDDMIDKPSGVGRSSKSPTSSPQDNNEKSTSDILSGRSRRQHQQQQKQPSPRSSGFIPIRPTTIAMPPSPPFKPRAIGSKSNAIISSSSVPVSARGGDVSRQAEDMDVVDDGVGSGGELVRKPTPTGKFSIRGNAVGVDAGCAGGGLGSRRGGATCVDSANGSFNNGRREERGGVGGRVIGARSGGVSSTNGSGASSTFAGNDSVSDISPESSSKNSSSSSPGDEEEHMADSNTRGKRLHAPIATAEALAAGSSGTTGAYKTSSKGKSKSPTPPPSAAPPKSDLVKNGEGGGAGVKQNDQEIGTRNVSSSSPVGANAQKTPTSGKGFSSSSSSSKSITTAANTTAKSRRPSPPPPLTIPDAGDTTVPAAASTSSSSSASSLVSADSHHDNSGKDGGERNSTKNGTSGIIDDSSNSSSTKPTKRRRRIARAATPPSGWQAPAAGGGSGESRQPYPDESATSSTSTTSTAAATSAQAKSAALPPTPATAAAGIAAATAAAADPGMLGRRSRRPGSSGSGGPDKLNSTNASPSSLLPSSYGRRAPSPTAATATAVASTPTRGGDSSSSSAGIKRADGENESGVLPVKKRSRPSAKDEGRSGVAGVAAAAVAAGAGAAQTGGGGSAAGGKAAPDKPTRGRGRPPGKGKGGGSNSTAKARGRRRLLIDGGNPRGPSNKAKDTQRWRTHRMVEDFVNTCGSIMYPQVQVGAFGYQPCEGRFPMERPTTLGILRTELRRPTVVEMWSPFQVACFEGAISIHGKVRAVFRVVHVSSGYCRFDMTFISSPRPLFVHFPQET